ncbi:MAG: flagellar type III secretion system pore protein FliP [Myxococcota bacterium]
MGVWLHIVCAVVAALAVLCVAVEPAVAQAAASVTASGPEPGAMLSSGGIKIEMTPGEDSGNLVPSLKLALLLMALSLLPAALVSVTSFTRIVIVLGFVRQALGTQSLPPNQVIIGLSLFLCLFTMGPTMSEVYEQAVAPYMNKELNDLQAVEAAVEPMRAFMARHTRPEELKLFVSMTQQQKPGSFDDVGTLVLVPAFMLSELRTAFIMGALIYIPFIIIDIVVASILMSMGMMMVPPAMISLPVKLLLFVLADGWNLVVASLARSIMAG